MAAEIRVVLGGGFEHCRTGAALQVEPTQHAGLLDRLAASESEQAEYRGFFFPGSDQPISRDITVGCSAFIRNLLLISPFE
jgi:hypothetical protein